MSEIQRSTPIRGNSPTKRSPAASRSEGGTESKGATQASRADQPAAETASTDQRQQVVSRLRSVQQRLARLQQERAQLRAERQQLRDERRAQSTGQTGSPVPPPPDATTPTAPQSDPAPATEPTPPASTQDSTKGITITGSVRQTQGPLQENDVALEDSTVARDRGIAGVRVDDPNEGVTFRFEDAGNGQVRATRFEMQDGQQVATGSQMLMVTGAGSDRGEAFGTLDFDELGLELDLDADFTPGDLQFVELTSGPSDDTYVAAGSLARADAAPSTETALDRTLAQLTEREQQIDLALRDEETALVDLLSGLSGSGDLSSLLQLMSSADERDRGEALRALTQSLVAQGSPSDERVLQLLA